MIDVWIEELFMGFVMELDNDTYDIAVKSSGNKFYWEEQFFKAYVDIKIGRMGINNPNHLLCREYIERNK